MKIKVNKNRWLDDYEEQNRRNLRRYGLWGDITITPNIFHGFEEEDVTPKQLMEYIKKGYGIKINC